ncbi:MAG TPA: DUF2147 domain-containing protein [Thermoanaerobaculia bacterium]|nr:DUF2147 domain-containing protein [Thermoanaerobaculia bacterium]
MRRPALLAALAALALLPAAAFAEQPDAILGTWLTEEGDQGGRAHVKVRQQGAKFVGEIVSLEEPNFPPEGPRPGQPKVDLENPDPKLRERPIVGLRILVGFRYTDGKWTGGTVYDPANGKTYRGQMTLKGPDTLELRGYVGIPLFGRTSTWKRVD